MAEFKTFTCDAKGCSVHNALRLKFGVDYQDDPADGKRTTVPGFADLCPTHMASAFQSVIGSMPMEEQRQLWKRILAR
jgi:hypothetical protein